VPQAAKASPEAATRGIARQEQAVQTYQGLPAKVQLPTGYRRTVFSREMLDTSKPVKARLLLVSRTWVGLLEIAMALVAAGLVFRERRAILAGVADRVAMLRQVREGDAAPRS